MSIVNSSKYSLHFITEILGGFSDVFSTVKTQRPWFQVDLQQFIKVTHVITQDGISKSINNGFRIF